MSRKVFSKIVEHIRCDETSGGCGHVFGEVLRASEGWKCPCPKCGHPCSEQTRERVHAFAIGNKPWGSEGESLAFAFDPSARTSIAATAPNIARAIQDDGTLMWENDSHQKAGYGEMDGEKKREEDRHAAVGATHERDFFNADQSEDIGESIDEE